MISIDSTVQDTVPARHRSREGKTTCGYCRKSVPKGHECAQKAEAMKERPCGLASCATPFKPKVFGQLYCCPEHKKLGRNQREYANKLKRVAAQEAHEKRTWPAKGFTSELNTIAPLERVWARAEKQAAQYVPVMGEALVEVTLRLMGAA